VNHLNAILHTMIGRITPGALGFVENAHGFVLMSGLVVGMVYGKRLIRQGKAALDHAILGRMRLIWIWHAALVVLFVAATILWRPHVPAVLAGYAADPIGLPLAELLLVGASAHMGILPMYLWFMMAVPFVLRAFRAGDMVFMALGSVALWLFAQVGAGQLVAARLDAAFAPLGYDSGFGLYFNVFGWQILFFAGLAAGWLMVQGRASLDWLSGRVALSALALFMLLFLGDRLVNDGWLSPAISELIAPLVHRGNFALAHLVSIGVDTVLLVWLLTKGTAGVTAPLAWLVRSILTFTPLVRLGQHSLQVFAAHLVLIYLVESLASAGQIPTWAGPIIILASPLWLLAAAWLHEAMSKPRPQAQTAA
jgi:hypothetical protein